MGMGQKRKVDFLHHAPALRRLLKEPPYLWQPLSPDGGNLEHWAGGRKWWWERVGMRDRGWKRRKGSRGKKEGGMEGVLVIAGKIPALLRKTNVWRGLCFCVYALTVSPGRLIYDTHWGSVHPFSTGKLENGRMMGIFKWGKWRMKDRKHR